MKIITTREMALKQKQTRKTLGSERSIVTFNGKPVAVTYPVTEETLENILNETALIEFRDAVVSMQTKAEKTGITQNDVENAIKESRKKRKSGK